MRRGGWAGRLGRDTTHVAVGSEAVLGVLALAAVVTITARGAPVWIPLREGNGDHWEILAGVLLLAGAVTLAGFVLTLVLHRARIPGGRAAPPLRWSLLRAAPITALAMAVLSLLAISHVELQPGQARTESIRNEDGGREPGRAWGFLDRRSTVVVGGEESRDPDEHAVSATDPGAIAPLLLLTIGIVLLAILSTIVWLRRRSVRERALEGQDDGSPATDERAVREAVAATIATMLGDRDPRTAVIGAYARLLEGLAGYGGGRHEYEAPLEHLRRVLTLLRVRREPLHELIELFEVARFSTHRVSSAHRDRAIAALHAVAADLDAGEANVRSPDRRVSEVAVLSVRGAAR